MSEPCKHQKRGVASTSFIGCMWCEFDRLRAENQRLKEENRQLHTKIMHFEEGLFRLVKELGTQPGLPLAGTVEGDKIVWRGVDSPDESDPC